MSGEVRVGFLGFGEAAFHIARDLAANGLRGIVAYSRSAAKALPGDGIAARAAEAGVALVASPRELCDRADVVIGLVPGHAALQAVRSVRPYLRAGHIYVDASTAAVEAMERGGALLDGRAAYVDAAIMGSVPLAGARTPIVASGPHAERLRELLAPYGMTIRVIPGKAGAATAMKLIRSVCMKGMAALLLESLEAAHRHGILDAVAADIAASIDERPFEQIIKRYVCGTAVHAERRVHEMSDAIALLRGMGAPSRMTRATRSKLLEVVELGLRERFGGREPESIRPVIEAIVAANT